MKMKMFRSLRSRLTLWYAVVLGLIFLVSDIVLYQGFKISLRDAIDNTLHTAAEEVEGSVLKLPLDKWKTSIKQLERGFMVNRLFIQIVEVPGEDREKFNIAARSGVLSGNISQRDVWARLSFKLPAKPVYMDVNEESPSFHPLRIIFYPVQRENGKAYLIQVGTSLLKMFNTLKNFLIILMVSGPVLLLFFILVGYFILRRALQPVKSVVQTARKITAEDLSLRIQSQNRKDEIGELITTFNEMISRLERSVIEIKQFSSDASHDLKTPLTIIRGEVEIALRKKRSKKEYMEKLTSIQEEAKKLERVIDNLLFLSRIDAQDHRQSFRKIQLDEILLEVFEKTEKIANEKGVAVVLKRMETLPVNGNPLMLNRLIMNLLDNAIKYTPAGGRVEISLTVKKDRKNGCLTIEDTGIGIAGDVLPYIFNRFYRVDQSRTQRSEGSGLGLSIVKKIADVHHAEVNVTSQPNRGTTARVIFPQY